MNYFAAQIALTIKRHAVAHFALATFVLTLKKYIWAHGRLLRYA
jgi:hypothetical protein